MGAIASQITSLPTVYSTVYSDADQRKHQSSASLAFVRGIHRWPVNSPHKWPVTRKIFPFDDVIMVIVSISMPCMYWSSPNIVTSTTGTQYLALTADIWGCFFIPWLFIHYTYALALLWNINTYSSTLKIRGGRGFSKAISSDFFIINKPTR